MDKKAKTIVYSDVFYSLFSEDAVSCVHQMADHVLVYVYSGELLITQGDKRYRLCKNESAFIRRDHRQKAYKRPYKGEQYKGIALVLKRELLREVYARLPKSHLPDGKGKTMRETFIRLCNQPLIDGLFASLYVYFDAKKEPSVELIRLKLQECVLALLEIDRRFYATLFDFSEPWKIDIMDFMNANYMYPLSLQEIATYTGRSLSTFKRDFKKLEGSITPERWVMKRRLSEVYKRVKKGGKPSEIYLEVGFKSLSHLYQAFKREYGVPPSQVIQEE